MVRRRFEASRGEGARISSVRSFDRLSVGLEGALVDELGASGWGGSEASEKLRRTDDGEIDPSDDLFIVCSNRLLISDADDSSSDWILIGLAARRSTQTDGESGPVEMIDDDSLADFSFDFSFSSADEDDAKMSNHFLALVCGVVICLAAVFRRMLVAVLLIELLLLVADSDAESSDDFCEVV